MKKQNDIIKSWEANASEWIRIIEEKGIASRKITNQAIVDEVNSCDSANILDLGCGEGWLTRALSTDENSVTGVDAIENLLKKARTKGEQSFYQLTYENIIEGKKIPNAPFDSIVLNFCLYQDKQVEKLLKSVSMFLNENGQILIQSIHPYFLIQNDFKYKSSWIENSWKGLPGNFVHPHAWFARTYEDWIKTFSSSGLYLFKMKEPINEEGLPASVIFTLKRL
ncbi:class I SAM-dependent methyltransferase [Christiangramia echinicola]|uniref:Methyltransferase domain-containing protein n=1 Tax=Christiangramia echinicola TaxID=279359 RepID=A0A1H1NKF8_9FLAO|nr:class I SAM-dependent methyltransferase [Christiangramia echinicola]SDR99531.1 Methyltransferase domain-containing protein [Christiangramia echinicola]